MKIQYYFELNKNKNPGKTLFYRDLAIFVYRL